MLAELIFLRYISSCSKAHTKLHNILAVKCEKNGSIDRYLLMFNSTINASTFRFPKQNKDDLIALKFFM